MTTGIMKKENRHVSHPATSFTGLVDQFFQNNLNRFFDDDLWGFNGVRQMANIPVNVRETGTTYELDIVAPGLRKEDFTLNVNGDLLTIAYEHKEEDQNKSDNWVRNEYKYQSFSRSFTLDDSMDTNKIAATYTDGILRLTLPKKEGAQRLSRNIAIK